MSRDEHLAANRRKWSEVRRSKTPTPAETAASNRGLTEIALASRVKYLRLLLWTFFGLGVITGVLIGAFVWGM